jgi:hypothetical protein
VAADCFAIEHTSDSRESQAVAHKFFEQFENHVRGLLKQQFGWRNLREEYAKRQARQQSVREWAIQHRDVPGIGGESLTHPSPYDRAIAFSAASQKVR